MNSKLTLKLDSHIIERAKMYAKDKNVSLSRLIENYLNFLTAKSTDDPEVTQLVKSLSGIVKLPDSYDEKKEYKKHLADKYSK